MGKRGISGHIFHTDHSGKEIPTAVCSTWFCYKWCFSPIVEKFTAVLEIETPANVDIKVHAGTLLI